jgi:REP element-mobilizing transposase RayT
LGREIIRPFFFGRLGERLLVRWFDFYWVEWLFASSEFFQGLEIREYSYNLWVFYADGENHFCEMIQKGKLKYRKSRRMKGYDYSWRGLYFVTICAKRRQRHWGKVVDGRMQLSEFGRSAHQCWKEMSIHFPHARVLEFVVMPDHVHGLIEIYRGAFPNRERTSWPHFVKFESPSRTIGSIVRGYKIGVVKGMRASGFVGDVWLRDYDCRIIFNQSDRHRVMAYIRNNPRKFWQRSGGNIIRRGDAEGE